MIRRQIAGRVLTISAAVVLAGSCREAPTPFESVDHEKRGLDEAVQLTYNPGTDHMPVWSVNGDSIYYTAAKLAGIPSNSNGVLLGLAADSGPAQVLLPELQSNAEFDSWLTSPAISSDGRYIAFIELYQLAIPTQCTAMCPPPYQDLPNGGPGFPELDSLRIRVFSTSTRTVVNEFTIRFNDRVLDTTRPAIGLPGTWVFNMHPYQARWAADQTPVFRPSWSPDGTRLVFSDGTKLLIWTVGQNAPQPIPNTDDAILPAWSPNGQTIAYTRVERGVVARAVCNCMGRVGVEELQDRIVYGGSLEDGMLTVIQLDGAGKREIGRGDAPAWTPGGELVFRRGQSLYVSADDGSNLRTIPNTSGGHVPSVSPDGRLVAFAKQRGALAVFDIWVAPLTGAQ